VIIVKRLRRVNRLSLFSKRKLGPSNEQTLGRPLLALGSRINLLIQELLSVDDETVFSLPDIGSMPKTFLRFLVEVKQLVARRVVDAQSLTEGAVLSEAG
jgi:hypothetical protein